LFFGLGCEPDLEEVEPGVTYTQDEIDYFLEIALKAEFGTNNARVHKWEEDLFIYVHGEPTEGDLDNLDDVVAGINGLQSEIFLSVVTEEMDANVTVYYTTIEDYEEVDPNYVPGSDGFLTAYWSEYGIHEATIFVRAISDETYRHHILLEELTQSLGLLNDADWYEESIFYTDQNSTTQYADIDRTVVSILYRPDIYNNMDEEDVLAVLDP